MSEVTVTMSREEALCCIIALERYRKPFYWQKLALSKLLQAMGLKPMAEK